MRKYYLGLNAGGPKIRETLFARGTDKDLRDLSELLAGKYQGAPILTKNGRSALCLALKAYLEPGDKVLINAFTCYAVYEAVVEAGMTPIFADISKKDLNFDLGTLKRMLEKKGNRIRGIIVQNSLGNAIDMEALEELTKKHGVTIVEDLAHSAGIKYYDGREAGTVGVATVLSFGKDKAINSISGGAVVLRAPQKHQIEAPAEAPRLSDTLRARFYPLLTMCSRGLNYIHLGGVMMRFFQMIHWVEKSADNKLDLRRRLNKFQARIAINQIKKFYHRGQPVLREFYFVRERDEVLKKLRGAGYFFDSFWYEKPVSPARYYADVQFPEKNCPVAMEVTSQIINFPKYYSVKELKKAHEIIKPYLIKDDGWQSLTGVGK
ncbi:MAG: aminotransferase class I/II-fold pyridoxal phosphate-dependent enzyme [Candidatus Saccharibacteria bacterium]|nr:aminotransferase class I/II-fold pyridoxal phosphate-dependent enzyme [Candidatus Saccharibacteria bacterium]